MAGPQTACDQEFGKQEPGQCPDMLEAKLWDNPCPFTFRLNYLALLYNTPLYSWIQDTYGLKRPEYVVLYSLAIANGGSARDVSNTSGFMGLIEARSKAPGGGRKQALRLSEKGMALFHETLPAFEAQEKRMLKTLTEGERQMLSELMSKVVMGAEKWAGELPIETTIGTKDTEKGQPQ